MYVCVVPQATPDLVILKSQQHITSKATVGGELPIGTHSEHKILVLEGQLSEELSLAEEIPLFSELGFFFHQHHLDARRERRMFSPQSSRSLPYEFSTVPACMPSACSGSHSTHPSSRPLLGLICIYL